MEFWKIAAITTWGILGALFLLYLFLKKNWIWFGTNILLGHRLHTSVNKLFDEIAEKKVKRETLANTSKHILWRFTRIGLFAILATLIPVLFLSIQTYLLKVQNDRIDLQNNLIEAQRRGSLIILMSNIMDQINEEISIYRRDSINMEDDSTGYPLSQPLIARIAGLSEGFLPYRIYQDGALSNEEYSTERGQLLLSLVNSRLDTITMQKIYQSTNFRQSYLSRASLRGADLRRVNLSGANLRRARLRGADLRRANLIWTDLRRARLHGARLHGADFRGADLRGADLRGADLRGANLRRARLHGAHLYRTDLRGADLREADLREAYFRGADFKNVRSLTLDQLLPTRSLYQALNIDTKIKKELAAKKPCLFTEEGCE